MERRLCLSYFLGVPSGNERFQKKKIYIYTDPEFIRFRTFRLFEEIANTIIVSIHARSAKSADYIIVKS